VFGTYLHFTIDSIAATDATSRTAARIVVAPAGAALTVRTVAGHMTCVTTDPANNACREVLALRAVVLPVTDLTTVLAGLVLIVSEGTVESSQLTQLVTLELVLTFGNRGSL
jgi:hypothetical protein